MSSPQQDVFDNLLLRRMILRCIFKLKYDDFVKSEIQDMVICEIQNKWVDYCKCPECISYRIQMFNIMDM